MIKESNPLFTVPKGRAYEQGLDQPFTCQAQSVYLTL